MRPDRELEAPLGCEWLETVRVPVSLGWNHSRLVSFVGDTMRRHLSEKSLRAAVTSGKQHRSSFGMSPTDRARQARVWGVRALNSGVVIPRDGQPTNWVQIHNSEMKWKAEMTWEALVCRLPPGKRASVKGKHAFGLYLAYDYGQSLHRDLRGKPRALVGTD